jgi:hypothetical protein
VTEAAASTNTRTLLASEPVHDAIGQVHRM